MVALNYGEIKWNLERLQIFNWDRIKYPSKIDDWEIFEKNNPTIALAVLYTKEMEICSANISKSNSTRKKQITLLMIPNEKGWHCLAVKKLPLLLRGMASRIILAFNF